MHGEAFVDVDWLDVHLGAQFLEELPAEEDTLKKGILTKLMAGRVRKWERREVAAWMCVARRPPCARCVCVSACVHVCVNNKKKRKRLAWILTLACLLRTRNPCPYHYLLHFLHTPASRV